MRIYTKTGDYGTTGLYGGNRISKSDLRIQAIGAVDELNAAIGWIRTVKPEAIPDYLLGQLQCDLFVLGSDLATPDLSVDNRRMGSMAAAQLENWIDEASEKVPSLRRFVLPGGSPAAAALHLCRTICRRAERSIVTLAAAEEINQQTAIYLNRLSDLLFVWARLENVNAGVEEVVW